MLIRIFKEMKIVIPIIFYFILMVIFWEMGVGAGWEASGGTLIVDDDGGACDGGRGEGTDFCTIQDAINASEDGDMIRVFQGKYYENIVVNKSIHLIGNGSGTTVIDAGGRGNAVNISAHDVHLRDFLITNGEAGISINNSEDCIISNNSLISLTIGINIFPTSHSNIIRLNRINHNEIGIQINSSLHLVLERNVIQRNHIGINHIERTSYFSKVIIHYNIIEENEQFGFQYHNSLEGRISIGYNFWGASSGPFHQEWNAGGEGDAITNTTSFHPWLENSDLPSAGSFSGFVKNEAGKTLPGVRITITNGEYHYSTTTDLWRFEFLKVPLLDRFWTITASLPGYHNQTLERYIDFSSDLNINLGNTYLDGRPDIHISGIEISKSEVLVNELVLINISVENKGEIGTYRIDIYYYIDDVPQYFKTIDYISPGSFANESFLFASDLVKKYNLRFVVYDDGTILYSSENLTIKALYPYQYYPKVQVSFPRSNSQVDGTIKITGIATDNSPIVRVEYQRDGLDSWHLANGTENWFILVNTSNLSEGKHTYQIRAFDGDYYSSTRRITIVVTNDEVGAIHYEWELYHSIIVLTLFAFILHFLSQAGLLSIQTISFRKK